MNKVERFRLALLDTPLMNITDEENRIPTLAEVYRSFVIKGWEKKRKEMIRKLYLEGKPNEDN